MARLPSSCQLEIYKLSSICFSKLLFSFLLLCNLFQVHAYATVVDTQDHDYFNCSTYNPILPTRGRGCLHRLTTHKEDYNECNDPKSNKTCYIFLQQPPFITIDPNLFDSSDYAANELQKPFPCGKYANIFKEKGTKLQGIAFVLHSLTISSDDLCMWGGHPDDCLFNELVDYIDVKGRQNQGAYRFGITGLLLEIPIRQCRHYSSSAFLDNSMIIIGRRNDSSMVHGPLQQLIRPFHWGSWAILIFFLIIFLLVCISIACRFHIVRRRSLVTGFLLLADAGPEAIAYERQIHGREGATRARSFATKYGLSMSFYRFAIMAYVGIFVLFYEVAVVNFLFQQQTQSLARSVKSLTVNELKEYSVLKDSALELVWNTTVNPGGQKFRGEMNTPWKRCKTATNCTHDVVDEKVTYTVTFEVVGKYLIQKHSDCRTLTIFETKDRLYKFNAGWLYNSRVDEARRKQVDRELVELQIRDTTPEVILGAVEERECSVKSDSYIGPMIILVPCLLFVAPALISSIAVLFLWKKEFRTNMMNFGRRRRSNGRRRPGTMSRIQRRFGHEIEPGDEKMETDIEGGSESKRKEEDDVDLKRRRMLKTDMKDDNDVTLSAQGLAVKKDSNSTNCSAFTTGTTDSSLS